jgi:hypothetical protein
MSRQTYVVWYTECDRVDFVRILENVGTVMGFERARDVIRHSESKCQIVARDVLYTELAHFYRPDCTLSIQPTDCKMAQRILSAILCAVPPRVLGECRPEIGLIRIGRSSLTDGARPDAGVIAHPTVVIGNWGYETPAHTPKFRDAIAKLRALAKEQAKLEALVGAKLTRVCYLSL